MDSRNIICFLALFILAFSSATALKCIQCSYYVDPNITNGSDVVPCDKRENVPIVPCEDGKVCSTIYDANKKLFTRSCDHKEICDNVPVNTTCTTCSSDLCGNSGYHINPLYAPVLAGLLFAALGR